MWLDYFDKVYCIHLPNDARRERIEIEFSSVGITGVEYIHAEPPEPGFHMSNMRRGPIGEFGCALSHIKAEVHAIHARAVHPNFYEDDVIFQPQARALMQKALHQLPPYWDVLYLGGHPRSTAHKFSDNLAEIGAFSFAEAYALRNPMAWIDFWCNRTGHKDAMVDIILGEYAAQNGGFCVQPLLTKQPPGISQISNREDNKDGCLKKGWLENLCRPEQLCDECKDFAIKSA